MLDTGPEDMFRSVAVGATVSDLKACRAKRISLLERSIPQRRIARLMAWSVDKDLPSTDEELLDSQEEQQSPNVEIASGAAASQDRRQLLHSMALLHTLLARNRRATRSARLVALLEQTLQSIIERLSLMLDTEKPVAATSLLTSVRDADEAGSNRHKRTTSGEVARKNFNSLTAREHAVLVHVLAGKPNKVIAADLRINQRTVEKHRAAVMRKTGAASLPELVRLSLAAEI